MILVLQNFNLRLHSKIRKWHCKRLRMSSLKKKRKHTSLQKRNSIWKNTAIPEHTIAFFFFLSTITSKECNLL